jgi:hypothetical protein
MFKSKTTRFVLLLSFFAVGGLFSFLLQEYLHVERIYAVPLAYFLTFLPGFFFFFSCSDDDPDVGPSERD